MKCSRVQRCLRGRSRFKLSREFSARRLSSKTRGNARSDASSPNQRRRRKGGGGEDSGHAFRLGWGGRVIQKELQTNQSNQSIKPNQKQTPHQSVKCNISDLYRWQRCLYLARQVSHEVFLLPLWHIYSLIRLFYSLCAKFILIWLCCRLRV